MEAARGQVVEDPAALEAHCSAWDELAVAASRPFCAPGWLMPWWRHAAPAGAELRVVLVFQAGTLIGVAPLYAERTGLLTRWRPLGAGTCERVEPLARRGRERAVARETARAVAGAGPHVVTFEGVPARSHWPRLLSEEWPGQGRPWVARAASSTALVVDLAAHDFDAWFMARTSHFRQRLRKSRKLLSDQGGTARLATPDTLERDIESLIRLHTARWEDRGGSGALTPAVMEMLRDVGGELAAGGRLRVWSLDVDGKTIASSIVLVAGGEVGYWLNGFDADYGGVSPSRLSILTVIEDGFRLGAERLDLGEGAFEYKRRFADGEETLEWLWVVPPGAVGALTRLLLLAPKARRAASERLSADARSRLKRLARRPQLRR
jgi:CelD/BcsL family acetyltransferase involved in cellulose biosynthesis